MPAAVVTHFHNNLESLFHMILMVKNLPANAEDIRNMGSTPGLGRSSGGGHGNPPVFSPGEFHGQRSLVGYSPQSCKELDMTEVTLDTSTHL